jgi:hypothetical protein
MRALPELQKQYLFIDIQSFLAFKAHRIDGRLLIWLGCDAQILFLM